ncbi:MAG: universal stress protein [Candidatus Accumulibacter sp.]|uniref:universal stress protein n=1 Tax=Accumulibacter sp. TaxID=2053492 RepID=UPI001A0BAF11|nr:universal stress protein [Accumulibacter sp.]MBE2260132.1 universal stress protein [Paracoccaceae bacterium]MCB1942603.1 universal stress protein [Accumulibacter sp.]MCP5249502.1 universal stress protein [Accumulibacter sp.]
MYKTILVPIDMAHITEGKAIVNLAASYGAQGSKIILLNVVEDIPNWAAVDLPAGLLDKSVNSTKAELKAIAEASGMHMDVDVRTGHSYETILDVAKENKVDLIIIASHRPGLQDYFLGSTAAKVVRHANCSVLVVR